MAKNVSQIFSILVLSCAVLLVVFIFTRVVIPWVDEGFTGTFEEEYIHVIVDCGIGENVSRFTGYVSISFFEKKHEERSYVNVVVYSDKYAILASVPSEHCFFQPVSNGMSIFR